MSSQSLLLRQRWQDGVNAHDINKVLECYTSDAIFKGTVNTHFTEEKDHIRRYFDNIFKRNVSVRFIGTPRIKQFASICIDYGDYEFCIDGNTLRAKYTFVYNIASHPQIISHLSYKIL